MTITSADILALLPLIIVSGAAVLVMLLLAFHRNHALTMGLTLVGLAAAFAALVLGPHGSRQVTSLIIMDSYARYFMGLMFLASFTVALFSYGYFERRPEQRNEFYIFLLLATLGAAVMAASNHFASFLLGLETLSVSLYTMIGYQRLLRAPVEAAMKYLILTSASSAFMLLGMAFIYGEHHTMEFGRLIAAVASQAGPSSAAAGTAGPDHGLVMMAGLGLIFVGLGFKLALVPFHFWTPDVYQGAPAPVSAFIATVSKGGAFALLLRFMIEGDLRHYDSLFLVLVLICIASMFVGNLLALMQRNVKRLLAYSSIAQLGYLLIPLLAGPEWGVRATAYFLAAYFVSTLGAFGVVAILSTRDREADSLGDYRGLVWRHPWAAGVMSAMLLSLAGIPLTAGFIGKFYIFGAGVWAAAASPGVPGAAETTGSPLFWLLVMLMVVNSAISLFYYLRLAILMYLPEKSERPGAGVVPGLHAWPASPWAELPQSAASPLAIDGPGHTLGEPAVAAAPSAPLIGDKPHELHGRGSGMLPAGARLAWTGRLALLVLTVLLAVLGLYPGPLLNLISRMVDGMHGLP